MSNAFTDYAVSGPAEPRRVRAASVADLGVGAFAAMLAWPFPVMRIVLTDATGSVALGWVVHVALLIASTVVLDAVCVAVFAALLHRTVGMYFLDLGFRTRVITPREAAGFAVPWALAAVPALLGTVGPANTTAQRRIGSTKGASGEAGG